MHQHAHALVAHIDIPPYTEKILYEALERVGSGHETKGAMRLRGP